MTADEAWALYQQGKLQNYHTPSVKSPTTPTAPVAPVASTFSGFDAGDWEGYFAAIRQSEGKAAAEEELRTLTSKGLIPKNMVNYAAIGARGGQMGH
jgi:hypothetical protein